MPTRNWPTSSSSTSPKRGRPASGWTCSKRVRSRARIRASSATAPPTKLAQTASSDVVVITAGLPRKPGMSRDDLLQTNNKIVQAVTEQIVRNSPDTIIVRSRTRSTPWPASIASASSRGAGDRHGGRPGFGPDAVLHRDGAERVGREHHAFVLGGHGDTMVPLPRYSTVAGIPITELLPADRIEAIGKRTADGGAEIISWWGRAPGTRRVPPPQRWSRRS